MKLRIEDDSVRLRLKRTEVEALCRGEMVEAHVHLSDVYTLTYAVEARDGIDSPTLDANPARITVGLPKAALAGWDTDARVGFEGHCPTAEGASVFVLVEKDFKCLDRPDEEEPDNYPNPLAAEGQNC